jgi:copper(I)-binding protein
MRKTTRRTLAKLFAAAMLLLAAGSAAAESPGGAVVVTDAWIAKAPPSARNLAAYLSLKNGPRPDALLSVKTPAAAVAELHETRKADGVTRMRKQAGIALAPNAELLLAPGGRHIMLINVKQALKPGDKVPLALTFRRAGVVNVQAEVRSPLPEAAAADPHAHHH